MQLETRAEIITVFIAGISLLFLLSGYIIYFLFLYQKKLQKHLLEKQSLQAQFAQTLLQSQFEIQEQTLQHLSRELHDNLGQAATLIKINLTTLKLDEKTAATEKIESTKDITRQLIGDIKALSVSLNSDRIAQTGLVKALDTEVQRLNKAGLFTAHFIHTGNTPPVENDKAVILYRMAQEVLNNMVKHSNAKRIDVNLSVTESLFILAFHDDGDGFDVEKQMHSGGAGLHNLHSRASLINAKLTIQSNAGSGTSFAIEMPL